MNLEVALEWMDSARTILTHMGFPPDLWKCVATVAMQIMG